MKKIKIIAFIAALAAIMVSCKKTPEFSGGPDIIIAPDSVHYVEKVPVLRKRYGINCETGKNFPLRDPKMIGTTKKTVAIAVPEIRISRKTLNQLASSSDSGTVILSSNGRTLSSSPVGDANGSSAGNGTAIGYDQNGSAASGAPESSLNGSDGNSSYDDGSDNSGSGNGGVFGSFGGNGSKGGMPKLLKDVLYGLLGLLAVVLTFFFLYWLGKKVFGNSKSNESTDNAKNTESIVSKSNDKTADHESKLIDQSISSTAKDSILTNDKELLEQHTATVKELNEGNGGAVFFERTPETLTLHTVVNPKPENLTEVTIQRPVKKDLSTQMPDMTHINFKYKA